MILDEIILRFLILECDGFVCGTGAQCIVSYDGPTCKCIEGFIGNPFPGGQCVPDVCSSEIPCAEPSVCISGRCKRRCEGVICGIGAMCDPLTNKCVCNPYFVGNPDLLCMPRKYYKRNASILCERIEVFILFCECFSAYKGK